MQRKVGVKIFIVQLGEVLVLRVTFVDDAVLENIIVIILKLDEIESLD